MLEELSVDNYPHVRAGQWIQTHMIQLLFNHPENYGIKILNDERIAPKNQILLQLVDLIQRPEMVERLCADLLSMHEKAYGENLGKEATSLFYQNRMFTNLVERQ